MAGENPEWVYTPIATWSATLKDHKGEVTNNSPKVEVPMCLVMQLEEGKIKRHW